MINLFHLTGSKHVCQNDLLLHSWNVAFSRFFLASFYTKYDQYHFVVNSVSLLAVLIPKLPQFDGVRLFGINAYW